MWAKPLPERGAAVVLFRNHCSSCSDPPGPIFVNFSFSALPLSVLPVRRGECEVREVWGETTSRLRIEDSQTYTLRRRQALLFRVGDCSATPGSEPIKTNASDTDTSTVTSPLSLRFSAPRVVDRLVMPTDFLAWTANNTDGGNQSSQPRVLVGREFNTLSQDGGQSWVSSHPGSTQRFNSVIHFSRAHCPDNTCRSVTTIGGHWHIPSNRTQDAIVANPTRRFTLTRQPNGSVVQRSKPHSHPYPSHHHRRVHNQPYG